MKPYINVSATFFSPDEGGRKESIYLNGYRPHFRVIGDSEYLGVQFIETPDKVVSPDEMVNTELSLLYFPDVSYDKMIQNAEFEILEGAKVVGKGKVISLVSSESEIYDELYYCPAVEKEIDIGLCWEYCFVDMGGPADTANKLKKWIELSNKYIDIEDFHNVCDKCTHCQWSR